MDLYLDKTTVAHFQPLCSEHIDFKARTVLTVNHVFEILVERLNGAEWPDALLSVLPKRRIKQNQE